ncbi:hypothetical protein LOK49_LG13G01210 [Camellia lanceoleosa]|uniref:Uncharacterized protein n=1 Tax=Camellia lanceoleosa TaxID=1840588 RepID=A0ACC0FMJ6_9ERIC|nr:hypothetical protein LOK49_LG13G01210 [Camellia lanceoleosa]
MQRARKIFIEKLRVHCKESGEESSEMESGRFTLKIHVSLACQVCAVFWKRESNQKAKILWSSLRWCGSKTQFHGVDRRRYFDLKGFFSFDGSKTQFHGVDRRGYFDLKRGFFSFDGSKTQFHGVDRRAELYDDIQTEQSSMEICVLCVYQC